MAKVNLRKVVKKYGALQVVHGIDLEIDDNECGVLVGPSGCGKSTMLRLIAGLEKAATGSIQIGGRDVSHETPAQRDVAMVFQQYSLYPHLPVRDNLAFPLRSPILKTPEGDIARKVSEVAEVLQISHKLDNKATALSGGEMQRVSIGRALVRDPAIYLMDEPLSSLDAKLRTDLRVELKRIQASLGATLLYVTHDQIEAMTMATHVGVLNEGRLVQFGTPREIYENPNSLYVASRLGLPRINVLPADIFGGAPSFSAPRQQLSRHGSSVFRPLRTVALARLALHDEGLRRGAIRKVNRLKGKTALEGHLVAIAIARVDQRTRGGRIKGHRVER